MNDYQRDFPLTSAPYACIAEQPGVSEQLVLSTLRGLKVRGVMSRLGPVFKPKRVGASTLAVRLGPERDFEAVAALVNSFNEVAHNHAREHRLNMWFVVAAGTPARIREMIRGDREEYRSDRV